MDKVKRNVSGIRATRPSRSTRYGHGRITRAPNGRGYDASIYLPDGRRRARLPDRETAQAWIDAQDRGATVTLTAAQLRDAQTALALLPSGATLTQAAKAYAQTHIAHGSLPDLFEAFLSARKDLRPKTLQGYQDAVRRFTRTLGPDLADYTTQRLRDFLDTCTPATHNQLLRSLSAILAWAVKTGRLPANPAATLQAIRTPAPRRAILTLPQTRALLAHAETHAPRALPYLPLCLFAGLRPHECLRLRPADIGDEYILLTEAHTKTASARTIAIRPNLQAWLVAYPLPETGTTHGLSRDRFMRMVTQAAREADITWAQDILRHSFASYAYETSRDASATAYEMGHQGTAIFFRHYRGLVPPDAGKDYFSILPTQTTSRQHSS